MQHLYLGFPVIMLPVNDQYGRSPAIFRGGLAPISISPEAEFRTRLILLRA
jgi:hypothetical protein